MTRELDAAVAEKVMKLSYILFDGTDKDADELIPAYSTDISAAWAVLEWLRKQFFSTKIIMWDHTDKVAIVCHERQGHDENIGDLEVEAPTAPEAICLAALKAVKEE